MLPLQGLELIPVLRCATVGAATEAEAAGSGQHRHPRGGPSHHPGTYRTSPCATPPRRLLLLLMGRLPSTLCCEYRLLPATGGPYFLSHSCLYFLSQCCQLDTSEPVMQLHIHMAVPALAVDYVNTLRCASKRSSQAPAALIDACREAAHTPGIRLILDMMLLV